ncbi:post-polyketide modification protein [Streptomyces albireticuli]|uniref:Post-polyketide modification protein n=1 Tax=Streptomyces albireticuli TaxID=1940 RepID=A0A1Z2LE08_9ACTN|nr:spirocyclase AveC family protein [Streptomyces albireticuli]ARZ72534.1 post-polyketide modification protein [Streptomyces albireticuli]
MLAALGMLIVFFAASVLVRWAIDGGAHSLPDSGYRISTARAVSIWTAQVVTVLLIVTIAVVLVRRCLRAGQVTFDMAVFVGAFLTSWQDPIFNYSGLGFITSHYAVHVASWGPYLPGWHSIRPENQTEAVLSGSVITYSLMVVWVWLQCRMTSAIARARPRWGLARLAAVGVLVTTVIDTSIQIPWMLTGLYTYPTRIKSLTILPEAWYGMPLNYSVLIAVIVVPFGMARYLLTVKSVEPLMLRGSELATGWRAGAVRILACAATLNILLFVFAVTTVLVMHSGAATTISLPSHLWP